MASNLLSIINIIPSSKHRHFLVKKYYSLAEIIVENGGTNKFVSISGETITYLLNKRLTDRSASNIIKYMYCYYNQKTVFYNFHRIDKNKLTNYVIMYLSVMRKN